MKQLPSAENYSPFAKLLGIRLRRGQGAECISEVEVSPELTNYQGVVHGGTVFALADSAMGGALYELMGSDEICKTLDVSIRYRKPAGPGLLQCRAVATKRRMRVGITECDVLKDGELIAHADGRYYIALACFGTEENEQS